MKLVRIALWSLCLLLPGFGLASPLRAETLADSTVRHRFTLANGLEVRTCSIPGAKGVAITLAYRAGTLYEPSGREGLADLLADIEFTAPAGDIPERTTAEMTSLRPLGFGVRTNRRLALLTEIATREQFPGVLRQVATRMRGVQCSEPGLKAALANTRRELGTRYFGAPDLALYYRSSELAHGATDERLLRRASGKGLDGLTSKEVNAQLLKLYVPSNAALALVGDLTGLDLEALVTQEFASIPAGVASAEPVQPPFQAGLRAMAWQGLAQPIGVLAVQAPALTDSLHPSFFLSALITAAGLQRSWGPPAAPLTSRFQYSIFDDPDFARFYPPVAPGTTDPQGMGEEFSFRLDELAAVAVSADQLDRVRSSVSWMFGAPLSRDFLRRAQNESGPLSTLGTSMATRALYLGDEFWDGYRERFETQRYGHSSFYAQMDQPARQFKLLLMPGK